MKTLKFMILILLLAFTLLSLNSCCEPDIEYLPTTCPKLQMYKVDTSEINTTHLPPLEIDYEVI